MKVRKRPVIVEAFQWTGDINQTEDPEWIIEAIKDGTVVISDPKVFFLGLVMIIQTLEGEFIAKRGHWIIRGINGEIYPCDPEIFKKTYDIIETGYPPTKNK